MRPVSRGPLPTRTTTSGRIQEITAETYGFFMLALATRLGEYCSFCEVSLGANLAVEHVLPKSVYPQAETDWNNFLLACPNCNSSKGTRIKARDGYIWPDTDATFGMLTYSYDGTICKVAAQAGGGIPASQTARAQAMIDTLNLNRYDDSDSGKDSDRRVRNRTATWTRATTMATALSAAYAAFTPATVGNAAAAPAIVILKQQIRATAVASGFWSVWMTVFGQADFVTPAARDQLLCDLFVSSFPGTRYPIANTTCN